MGIFFNAGEANQYANTSDANQLYQAFQLSSATNLTQKYLGATAGGSSITLGATSGAAT
jgi:hypothetical protein